MENNKKLERDMQNKVLGGVCSGLANYFDVDVTLLRILFACLFVFATMGFWLYLILWAVMPAGQVQNDSLGAEDGVSTAVAQRKPQNKGGLALGLILIGIGAAALLHRFVPEIDWQTAWPVLLIVLGVILIIPKKK